MVNVVVEELLLGEIRLISAYAREHKDEFAEMAMSKSVAALNKSRHEFKRET